MRRAIFVGLILLLGGCATTSGEEPELQQEQAPPAVVVEGTSTTTSSTTTTSTTKPQVPDTAPILEGDGDAQLDIDRADPVKLIIERVDIDAPVVVTAPEQTNACGRKANPCEGELDLWVDTVRVGVCELGPSFITGHLSYGSNPPRPDTFTNLIDDEEHEFDDGFGVQAGDKVVVELADGSQCSGTVLDFLEGPGKKIEGTPARFFDKMSVQDPNPATNAATRLSALAENKSLGFLFTSYCGVCQSADWYAPGELGDNSWHRRYNAVVMVEWQLTP